MINKIYSDIYAHLLQEFPREACGIVAEVNGEVKYLPAENLAQNNEDFIMSPECLEYVDDVNGRVLYIVHTHPHSSCAPSTSDLLSIEEHGYPWLIMDMQQQVKIIRPQAQALEGREFNYGINDCFTLVTDYYKQVLDIEITEFPRISKHWWDDFGSVFEQLRIQHGFRHVGDLKPHDILIMKLNERIPNHFAIYLGDGKMLHHPIGRLSLVENLTPQYYKAITYKLRKE